MLLEVSDKGELILPAELVQAPPHTRMEAQRQGEQVVLKPVADSPPPELTPAARAAALLAWARRNQTPVPIPLEGLRRENLYD